VALSAAASAGLICALLAATIAFAAPSTAAHPTPQDIRATHRYLQLDFRLIQTIAAGLPASLAAADQVATAFNSECPNVLAGAPTGSQLGQLGTEEVEVIGYTLIKPSDPAAVRFAQAISHLRWSNTRVTALVHALAAQDLAEANLAIPNLCADMKTWVASGYRTIPPDASRFLKTAEGSPEIQEPNGGSVGLVEAVEHRLSYYRGAADRTLARHIAQLKSKLTSSLTTDLFAAATALHDGRARGK
jgi:hypothetical protein